jgi:hypothetical protein
MRWRLGILKRNKGEKEVKGIKNRVEKTKEHSCSVSFAILMFDGFDFVCAEHQTERTSKCSERME